MVCDVWVKSGKTCSLHWFTTSRGTDAASPTIDVYEMLCLLFHLSIQVADTFSVLLLFAKSLAFSSKRLPSTGVLVCLTWVNQINKLLSTLSFFVLRCLFPLVLPCSTAARILSLYFSHVPRVLFLRIFASFAKRFSFVPFSMFCIKLSLSWF